MNAYKIVQKEHMHQNHNFGEGKSNNPRFQSGKFMDLWLSEVAFLEVCRYHPLVLPMAYLAGIFPQCVPADNLLQLDINFESI